MAKHHGAQFVTIQDQIVDEPASGPSLEYKNFLLARAKFHWEQAQLMSTVRFEFYSPDKGESRFVPIGDPALKFVQDGVKYTSRMTKDCIYIENDAGLGIVHRWR